MKQTTKDYIEATAGISFIIGIITCLLFVDEVSRWIANFLTVINSSMG